MAPRDLYVELGIQRNASDEDLKRAFRRAALRWHPDKHCETEEATAHAEEMFKSVNFAYDILRDPAKRSLYDQGGLDAVENGFVTPAGFTTDAGATYAYAMAQAYARQQQEARQQQYGAAYSQHDQQRQEKADTDTAYRHYYAEFQRRTQQQETEEREQQAAAQRQAQQRAQQQHQRQQQAYEEHIRRQRQQAADAEAARQRHEQQRIAAEAARRRQTEVEQEALRKAEAARRVEAQQQEVARQEDAARRAAAARNAEQARREAARQEAARQEAARQEVARQEAARQEAARQEAARQQAARQEAARQEAARQEAARQEAARQEAARQEAARQEAARQEAARQEAARQEAARQEAARQQVAAAHRAEAQRQESAAQFSRQVSHVGQFSRQPSAVSLPVANRNASPISHYEQHQAQHASAVQAAREAQAQAYQVQAYPQPQQQQRQRPALNTEELVRAMTESATQRAHTAWSGVYGSQSQQLHGALDVAPTFTAAAAPGWTTRPQAQEARAPVVQPPKTTGAFPMTQNPMNAPPAVLSPTYSTPQQHYQQPQQQQVVRRASTPVMTTSKPATANATTVYQHSGSQAPGSAPSFGPAGAVVSITTRIVGDQKFTRRVERYPAPDGSIRERVLEYVSNNTNGTPHQNHLRAPMLSA